jgi:hypothetical protein
LIGQILHVQILANGKGWDCSCCSLLQQTQNSKNEKASGQKLFGLAEFRKCDFGILDSAGNGGRLLPAAEGSSRQGGLKEMEAGCKNKQGKEGKVGRGAICCGLLDGPCWERNPNTLFVQRGHVAVHTMHG